MSDQPVMPASGATGPSAVDPEQLRRPRTARSRRPEPAVPAARSTGTPPAGLTGPIRQLLSPMTGSLRLGRNRDGETRLRVDWPQCKAHGLCAELAPDVIHLDEWGYPFVEATPMAGDDLAAVRKAVLACPTLALRLVEPPG
jgi:ferredoxin